MVKLSIKQCISEKFRSFRCSNPKPNPMFAFEGTTLPPHLGTPLLWMASKVILKRFHEKWPIVVISARKLEHTQNADHNSL